MNRKKQNLKFLSKSVLLEESGLPRINTYTILAITSIVVLFLIWSNFMIINDTLSVSGHVKEVNSSSSKYIYTYKLSSRNISAIELNQIVEISIPGITSREAINGYVKDINRNAFVDARGNIYYEVEIYPDTDSVNIAEMDKRIINGMEVSGNIIIGSRTLLQYMLGPLWDVGNRAFNSN